MAHILTIGELLWDVFPDGTQLGGAPANVAFHLRQAGHEALIASSVGDDERGRRALEKLRMAGVDTSLVTIDANRPTGIVQVAVDAHGGATFEISAEAAWDHIGTSPELVQAAARADVIVFGTLAQRHPESSATIAAAIEISTGTRVLDLNLRPPHVTREIVQASLARADILKLNDEERDLLAPMLGDAVDPLEHVIAHSPVERIYMTRGALGCEVIDGERRLLAGANEVEIADTVGAGDAFTAAMIDGELRGLDAERTAANANLVGAFVASRPGAMPAWTDELVSRVQGGNAPR